MHVQGIEVSIPGMAPNTESLHLLQCETQNVTNNQTLPEAQRTQGIESVT